MFIITEVQRCFPPSFQANVGTNIKHGCYTHPTVITINLSEFYKAVVIHNKNRNWMILKSLTGAKLKHRDIFNFTFY